jgi:pyruvate/2-oxoglutarate dehydrogenase complex dihydrolipoamide acyltransferase (E2) component
MSAVTEKASNVVEVRVPNENVNDETVTILQWRVKTGDRVSAEQPLVEVETSKATFDIPAPAAGVVRLADVKGAEVPIGAVIAYVGESVEAIEAGLSRAPEPRSEEPSAAPAPVAHPAVEFASAPSVRGTATRIGPKARACIRKHNLSEELFNGRGLVTEQHVLEYVAVRDGKAPPKNPRRGQAAAAPLAQETDFTPATPVERRELPRLKRLEARYLAWSKSNALPSLVTVAVPTRGLRLRPNPDPFVAGLLSGAVIFESARLLLRYPQFNAYHAGGALNVYKDINIGFAIEAGQGLKVPIIRNANAKTLPQIVAEKQALLADYLDGQLTPEKLFGGTFTVTDLSGEQVFSFTPLINQGQSAILGVGAEVPVGGGGGSGAGMYNLMLAFDHQVADGRAAAQFLSELRERMIGYEQSLLGGAAGDAVPEPACESCYRTASQLVAMNRHLLKSIGKTGTERLVCTICAQGW